MPTPSPSSTASSASPAAAAVSAKGVGRRMGGAWALRSVDLEVPVGRTCMLFGANGAGKTTLIRLLGTAIRPSLGTLRLFGGPAPAARARIGMLSHADHHYDDLSAAENLRLGAMLSDPARVAHIPAVLAEVGLGARADDAVRGFSAGMRKRLAFARLLLKDPELILLDEPYAQLDPAGHELVDRLLRGWRGAGRTVLVSTHQVARVSALCEEAVQLDRGVVAWQGPAVEAPLHLAPGGEA